MPDDTATLARAPDLAPAPQPDAGDLLAQRFFPDPGGPLPPSSATTSAPKPQAKGGLPLMTYALAALVVAVLLWGAWVTKRVSSPVAPLPIASVRLEAIVSEYVRAQSHSNAPQDQVARETAGFMAALDAALRTRGAAGTTVLVGEAVLSQNVPDITDEIRKAVYAKVPLPVPATGSAPAGSAGALPAGVSVPLAPPPFQSGPFESAPVAPLPEPGLAPAN